MADGSDLAVESVPVVAVGASAGGLEALREVFQAVPDRPGMAFVVVQHLDPNHESLMAQLLERYTKMAVKQAEGGELLQADHIYVIPPGHGLAIADGVLRLTEFRDPRGLRRPIDDFFESLAEDRGSRAACVILSGTGADGSRGLRAIKEHGGMAVVQEPRSARYDGMPVSAISTGLVDIVVPPGQVIESLRSFFDRAETIEFTDEATEAVDHIGEMCLTLQQAVGHDFKRYKRSTLARRIARRMQVIGAESSEEYLSRLRSDQSECEALFRDLLINVTRFFRDREEFAKLERLVIDPLIADSREASEVRIWVAGCSSGEEAYTIAILVAEAMRRHERRPYVQIFATDIDDKMLEIARHATYPLAALGDIPPELHPHYLQIGPDHFTISPRIRDMVRFSLHNLVRDPPYSKIDLVSCRNLLIYFDEELQREVLPLFHFALKSEGKLFLGSSETIGRFEDLFRPLEERSRLYERRDAIGRYVLNIGHQPARRTRTAQPVQLHRHRQNSVEIDALKRIAARYAPVSLLVDSEGTLLEQWGSSTRYLEFPERLDQQLEVARLVKPGLREVVGPLLRDVVRDGQRRIARDVEVRTDFGRQRVNLVVDPVAAGTYLVIFKEAGDLEPEPFDDFEEYVRGDGELRYLQEELQSARLSLRTTVEELETANEELKSSNEEMMSMNEELQSTNEELTTVNDELKAKVDQLTMANADLKNFFDSTELVVLVVDADQNLRSYTDAAKTLFDLDRNSIGRPLDKIGSSLGDDRYLALTREVVRSGQSAEYPVPTSDKLRQFIARILPYRLLDGSVHGATLVFTDVTQALALSHELTQERARLQMALDVAKIGVWEYEPSSGETLLDQTERDLLGIADEADGLRMDSILERLPNDDRDRVNSALLKALDGQNMYDEVFRVITDSGETRWMHGLGRRIEFGESRKFIGVTFDVTSERELLDQRDLMIREMNHRVKNLFAIVAALTSMSARNASSVDEFARNLRDRIHALGRAHILTADRPDGDVFLNEIIETLVEPARNGQKVQISGDPIIVPNGYVTPLALILHEWVTNSTKYGAFSSADGKLAVVLSQGDEILIEWDEQGGNGAGDKAEHVGFGTQLVAASAKQLRGAAEAHPTDKGYVRRLRIKPFG